MSPEGDCLTARLLQGEEPVIAMLGGRVGPEAPEQAQRLIGPPSGPGRELMLDTVGLALMDHEAFVLFTGVIEAMRHLGWGLVNFNGLEMHPVYASMQAQDGDP